MYKRCYLYFIPVFTAVLLFFSCSPAKKAASNKETISQIDKQLEEHKQSLAQLDAQRKLKQQQNEIDDTASSRIHQFIEKTKMQIDTTIKGNSLLIGETVVAREDWNKLKKALTASQKSLKNIKDKESFIADLLKRNTVVKLDQDVIFQPGQYEVSSEVAAAIGSFFEPAAAEIDLFIKKYPSFPLSLVITAKGYADGTTIATGSELYRDLKDRLKLQAQNPDNKELNRELSRARAEKVIALFQQYTSGRTVKGKRKAKAISNILYLYEGKGETFPDPKVTNYKIDDARRRVVLLFWSIFPE